jgi:hypothetical protein
VRSQAAVRLGARFAVIAVAGVIALMLAAQYAHIVRRNLSYLMQLRSVQADIVALERKRIDQQHEIARLSDPQGAIPEIHDRLHLVGDHEEIIYLKRAAAPGGAE